MRDNSYITVAFKKKMSEKLKGNKNALGHTPPIFSQAVKNQISAKLKGIKRSKETRLKMSLARKGKKPSPVALASLREAGRRRWKPWEKLTYGSRHYRIRILYGKPTTCDHCGKTGSGFYDWSNISFKYQESRKDWERLCRKCHGSYESKARGGIRRNVPLKLGLRR